MGRSAELARRYAIWAILLALALPSVALAQSSAEEAARALEDKLWFVERLARDFPGGAFWRTWGDLEEDVAEAVADHPGDAALVELHRRVRLSWGRVLAGKGMPVDAEAQFRELLAPDVPPAFRVPAAAAVAAIREAQAAAETDRDRKVQLYREAEEFYLAGNRPEDYQRVKSIRVDLQAEAGLERYRKKEYEAALGLLESLEKEEGELPPGEAADALADIRRNTGVLVLETLTVPIPGTEVVGAGRVLLTPRGSGERWGGAAPGRLRWRSGTYQFELSVGGQAVVSDEVTIDASTRARVQVPEKVPQGMVFIRASPSNGVPRPFFMDRTEVTVRELQSEVSGYTPIYSGTNLPAHGVSYSQAQDYARKVRKALPTKAQWIWAAFGGSDRKFPWAGTSMSNRCNFGTRAPTPVGSYPDGASVPFGLLDMAGNVWEWLQDEEAIGGGFRVALDRYEAQGFNPLRKPKYSRAKWERTGDNTYQDYQVHPDRNMQEVGLRCVLELRE